MGIFCIDEWMEGWVCIEAWVAELIGKKWHGIDWLEMRGIGCGCAVKLEGALSWVVLYACVRVIVTRDLIVITLIWKLVVQDVKLCLQAIRSKTRATHGSIRPSAPRMLSTPGAEQHKGRAEWRGSGYCSIPMQATLSSSVGACDYPGWS